MHPKTEQNRSSTLGPVGILKDVCTSRVSSKYLLTTAWILVFNHLIYCQNYALLEDE